MDVEKMAEAVLANVRAFIAPLVERIRALETSVAELPEPVAPPTVGELVSEALPLLVEEVQRAVDAIPKPQDGAPGTSVSLDDVRPVVLAETEKWLASFEQSTGAKIQSAIDAIPIPKDGAPGESVTVEDIHPVLMLETSKWAVDFERRAQDVLQRAIDKMPPPKDGKDGRDAIALDSFELSLGDDGRTVTAMLKAGETEITRSLTLNTVLDAGFYQVGKQYAKGDGVTFGGSFWISQYANDTKPEIGNPAWRLAVKKGRDGKDGALKPQSERAMLRGVGGGP